MNRIYNLTSYLLSIFILAACTTQKEDKLTGKWVVDSKLTVDKIYNNPDFQKENKQIQEKFLKTIKYMSKNLVLDISDDRIIIGMGSESEIMNIFTKQTNNSFITFNGEIEGDSVDLIIEMKSDKVISFKSASSEELNFLVWKKVKE
ncbi:hypothetical protein ACFLS9_07865 [Bacteroidota bacterium]